jgi:hypothetical protein
LSTLFKHFKRFFRCIHRRKSVYVFWRDRPGIGQSFQRLGRFSLFQLFHFLFHVFDFDTGHPLLAKAGKYPWLPNLETSSMYGTKEVY